MIVTEQEAKTKRCQESFGDTNLGSGYIEARAIQMGTQAFATSPINCMGSACMAWRWRGYRDKEEHIFSDAAEHGTGPTERVGCCGKAGKP